MNCTTVRSDFHQLSKDFPFHSMRKQVDLLLESNVRYENEENFFYLKKKIVVYKTKYLTMRQNLSSDNERLGLLSDEQDNENRRILS